MRRKHNWPCLLLKEVGDLSPTVTTNWRTLKGKFLGEEEREWKFLPTLKKVTQFFHTFFSGINSTVWSRLILQGWIQRFLALLQGIALLQLFSNVLKGEWCCYRINLFNLLESGGKYLYQNKNTTVLLQNKLNKLILNSFKDNDI